jgi:hypothetical protein
MNNSIKKSVLINRYNRFFNYLNEGKFNESRMYTISECLSKIEEQIQTIK